MKRENRFRTLYLISGLMLLSSSIQASELEGMVDALIYLFLSFVLVIIATIAMFWIFRKNTTFVVFSFCNYILFFLLATIGSSLDTELLLIPYFLAIQFFVQVTAILLATIHKIQNRST